MPNKYAEIFFTEQVQKIQQRMGSREAYAAMEQGMDSHRKLGDEETRFIKERDSFYMASVSESGWPYIQHRGGPVGFVRVLNETTLGFADFSGNRQYISAGNLRSDDRVSLFFMDYPNRRRLKLAGRIERVDEADWHTLARIEPDDYQARIERVYKIHVEGFDWNCPQHITPRYSELEMQNRLLPLIKENRHLKAPSKTSYPCELGQGSLPLRISSIKQLTPEVRAYQLAHAFEETVPPVNPGSHLTIPVQLPNGQVVYRSYSISSHPHRTDSYEIAVKREPNGQGASQAIHENFQLGLVLNCAPALNSFRFQLQKTPVVLIAGGIGITAIKPMAEALLTKKTAFQLFYAGRSRKTMPYLRRLSHRFKNELHVFAADLGQRLNLSKLFESLEKKTQVYVCGPEKMIRDCYDSASATGFNTEQITIEYFKPVAETPNKPLRIQLVKRGKTLPVTEQESILDALIAANVPVAYACKTGICKSCAVEVLSGEPEHRDTCLSDSEKQEKRLFCPCVSRSVSDSLTLNL